MKSCVSSFELDISRDRNSSFEPQIVKKSIKFISLRARGPTFGASINNLNNRDVEDILIASVDGLNGFETCLSGCF